MNKGRWTEYKCKIFMQEWEKYANNLMQIAKVINTRKTTQTNKQAECFFKHIFENKFGSSSAISRISLSQWESTSLGQ
jgi:hypothetical protein